MEYNDYRAAVEADAIARDGYTVNGPGAMADEAIGRIAKSALSARLRQLTSFVPQMTQLLQQSADKTVST